MTIAINQISVPVDEINILGEKNSIPSTSEHATYCSCCMEHKSSFKEAALCECGEYESEKLKTAKLNERVSISYKTSYITINNQVTVMIFGPSGYEGNSVSEELIGCKNKDKLLSVFDILSAIKHYCRQFRYEIKGIYSLNNR